jgi:hypothetical protein
VSILPNSTPLAIHAKNNSWRDAAWDRVDAKASGSRKTASRKTTALKTGSEMKFESPSTALDRSLPAPVDYPDSRLSAFSPAFFWFFRPLTLYLGKPFDT